MKNFFKNYSFIIMMLTGVIAGCIVGAGSVVITDMKEKGTYAGIPARKMA